MNAITICARIITDGFVELATSFDDGRLYDHFMWINGKLHLWAVGTPASDDADLILGEEGI